MSAKSLLPSIFISFLFALSILQANAKTDTNQNYERYSKRIYPELLEIRRDLFAHPEASGQEKRTSSIVADYLTKLGLEVKTNVGGYGVVGILKGGKSGKRIAWRADMDAASFEYGAHDHSEHNLAHVCGHDVHTTIGLGIANTLAQDIENIPGTIYFLFQPAEESQQGAKAMINDGLFDVIQVDEIYAAHVGPSSTGVISTKTGNVFAHSRYIQIEFTGIDNTQALSDSIQAMMQPVTRLKSPKQFADLLTTTDPTVGMAHPETIYQDYVLFGGAPTAKKRGDRVLIEAELYTAEHDDIAIVLNELEQRIRGSEFKDRFRSIRALHEREGVNNDARLVNQTKQLIKNTFGEDAYQEYFGQVPFASEDFGHFQRTVPGVYFFIGASNAEKGIVAFPHMPNFAVDEMVIHHGVTRFSTLINERLKQ